MRHVVVFVVSTLFVCATLSLCLHSFHCLFFFRPRLFVQCTVLYAPRQLRSSNMNFRSSVASFSFCFYSLLHTTIPLHSLFEFANSSNVYTDLLCTLLCLRCMDLVGLPFPLFNQSNPTVHIDIPVDFVIIYMNQLAKSLFAL